MRKVHERKARLRPARDVISRLRWSPEGALAEDDRVVFGYVDRINGTMEKAVEDYLPMSEGGDIPEHRILYFRRVGGGGEVDDAAVYADLSNNIIWDRGGRVDRVFDSGYENGDISKETVEEARAAIANMARLEEEKAERREQKARARARRARARVAERKVASMIVSNHDMDGADEKCNRRNRFEWRSVPWHHYDESRKQWTQGGDADGGHGRTSTSYKRKNPNRGDRDLSLKVLTWNVLSNIHPGVDTDENGVGGHEHRWALLAEAIREQSPDVVALQEATPEFADQILTIDWVRADYASSISPRDKSSVDPIGNVLLWKKSHVDAGGLHACVDGTRWRAISADLRFGANSTLACANAHLPSDKPGAVKAEDKVSRQVARRRELSSIVGHLQRTELHLKRKEPRTDIIHLILGDFNCGASELEDGTFAGSGGYFQDVWSKIHRGASCENLGCTFVPTDNPRAAKSSSSSSGRRIDRMYLNDGAGLEPVRADVIRGNVNDIPPSDHYGLCAQFRLRHSKQRNLYNPLKCNNAWAANAPSSKDSMLAIIIDSEKMEQMKGIYDPDSSLPSPHITLLYGFVELHHGCLGLAVKAIEDSVIDAFQDQPSSPRTIFFNQESLDVFEHRSSTTLIARPNLDCGGNKWLMALYSSLKSRFLCCNDQELYSARGFAPHVSLGKFGFTSSARQAAAEMEISSLKIPVRSIDVLGRSQSGKFRSIASVPFSSPPKNPSKGLRYFIEDTGNAASSFFTEKSQIVVSIINRASWLASRSFGDLHLAAEAIPYGSVALDCALPKMSDLDVVIMLYTNHEIISPSQFLALADERCAYLKRLMKFLRDTHAVAKMRLRPLRSGLKVLSVQIHPNLPSSDILLCLLGHDDKPLGESDQAFASIQDNERLMNVLTDIEARMQGVGNSFSLKDVFCASLRLIKLWAYNRGVYGAKFGFLGGGSWAIFLAYVMKSIIPEQEEAMLAGTASLSDAAHFLTLAFFGEASRWPWPRPISFGSCEIENQYALLQPRLAVLSPSLNSNLAKNSTMSTCLSTAAELRRASALGNGVIQNDNHVACLSTMLAPLRLQEFIASSPEIIALELSYDNEESLPSRHLPDDVEAWGCSQYLSFLVNLERKLDAPLLRPFSRAFKLKGEWKVDFDTNREGHVWIIGLCCVLSKEERDVVEEISSGMARYFGESMDTCDLDLSTHVLSSYYAIERIVA